jgi:hypothetical protein
MRKSSLRKLLGLVVLVVLLYSGDLLLYPVSIPVAMAQEDGRLVSEPYKGQNTFRCSGQDFKVPSYFPYVNKWPDSAAHFTALEKWCSEDNFQVTLGIGNTCPENFLCEDASFSVSANSAASGIFEKTLSVYARKISLAKNIHGYLIPSVCGANCDDTQLVWFMEGRVFIIGSHYTTSDQETLSELTKAANSYIEQER